MRIRAETEADLSAIRAVNKAAFARTAEAALVDALRAKGLELISLVAEFSGIVAGHILFSPVSLREQSQLNVMGLGPMAVVPAHQREGIGSALVREGLDRCRLLGCHAVVVLGHANYYRRFEFVPAARYALRLEYEVPEDAFMVAELEAGALQGHSGVICYDEAFDGV